MGTEDPYRKVIEEGDTGFCVLELLYDDEGHAIDYRFVEVNRAFESQTGLVDVTGERAYQAIPGLEPYWLGMYAELVRTGEPVRFENEAVSMGRWFSVFAVRLGGEGSRRVAVQFSEISARRKAERALRELNAALEARVASRTSALRRANVELRELNEKLEEKNATLDQFTFAASHDLKAPLNAITTIAKWLREDSKGTLNDECLEHLDLIDLRIWRMHRMLQSMLQFARAGREGVQQESVSLCELVEEAFALVEPPVGFRLEVDCPKEPVEIERAPLETVIRNLVGNAVRHHDRAEGVVGVTVRSSKRGLRVEVSDNGPGIPKDRQDDVFKPFRTLKRRDDMDTSGFGLAIARKILEQFGSKLHLTSEGRGSVFAFVWPTKGDDQGLTRAT